MELEEGQGTWRWRFTQHKGFHNYLYLLTFKSGCVGVSVEDLQRLVELSQPKS